MDVYTLLACVMVSPTASHRYMPVKLWLDRAAKVGLGAPGLRLLLSRWALVLRSRIGQIGPTRCDLVFDGNEVTG